MDKYPCSPMQIQYSHDLGCFLTLRNDLMKNQDRFGSFLFNNPKNQGQ